MFDKDKKNQTTQTNPFEEPCLNCISNMWEIINKDKNPEDFFIPSTKIKIEKFKED